MTVLLGHRPSHSTQPTINQNPVQMADLVFLTGTNWIWLKSLLTRTPMTDEITGDKLIHYRLQCNGEIIGKVASGVLTAQLGLWGLFKDNAQYVFCEGYSFHATTSLGDVDRVDLIIGDYRTDQIIVNVKSSTDGSVRVKCMFDLTFTLSFDADVAIKPPLWT